MQVLQIQVVEQPLITILQFLQPLIVVREWRGMYV